MKIFDNFQSENPKSQSLVIMSQHMRLWRLCGYWPRSTYTTLYYCYSIVLHIIVSFLLTFSIFMSLTQATRMDDVTEIAMPGIVSVVTTIKGFLIYRNRKYISKLFGIMQAMEATGQGQKAAQMWDVDKEQAILNGAQKICTNMLIAILVCTNLCITMCFILPFFRKGRILMWPALFPWNWQESLLLYYLTNVGLFAMSLFHGFMMSTGDVYGPALYIFLGAHFDILGLRLRNLGKRSAECVGKPNELEEASRSEMELIECVKYHLMSMK